MGLADRPTGFELALLKLADRCPNVPILVAENGLGNRDVLEPDCTVRDDYRIAYHRGNGPGGRSGCQRGRLPVSAAVSRTDPGAQPRVGPGCAFEWKAASS